jgi:hypothetical protein
MRSSRSQLLFECHSIKTNWEQARSLIVDRRNVALSPLVHNPELVLFWKLTVFLSCFTGMTIPATRSLMGHDSPSFKI